MTIPYVEIYIINGTKYGIEDYKDGRPDSEHFMPDKTRPRYMLWRGGCGIGQHGTLGGTRMDIFNHALKRAVLDHAEAIVKLTSAREVIMALRGPGGNGLQEFRVENSDD